MTSVSVWITTRTTDKRSAACSANARRRTTCCGCWKADSSVSGAQPLHHIRAEDSDEKTHANCARDDVHRRYARGAGSRGGALDLGATEAIDAKSRWSRAGRSRRSDDHSCCENRIKAKIAAQPTRACGIGSMHRPPPRGCGRRDGRGLDQPNDVIGGVSDENAVGSVDDDARRRVEACRHG